MKKDIPELRVEDLAIVISPREDETDDIWDVFVFNLKEEPITNVLIVSKGYGRGEDGEERKTTTLRHFIEYISPLDIVPVEPIDRSLFWMAHEYWVSFSHDGQLYDKKYVFVPGSIEPTHFMHIPFIERAGVMIR